MEFMVVVGIIIWLLNSIGKANKKTKDAQNKRPHTSGSVRTNPKKSAVGFEQLQKIMGEFVDQIDPQQQMSHDQEEWYSSGQLPTSSYYPIEDRFEGDSISDDQGCFGGSLLHDQHEGEEFPGHLHSISTVESTVTPEPQTAQASPAFDSNDMKRAVIMAEVLGRPISRRRGGAIL